MTSKSQVEGLITKPDRAGKIISISIGWSKFFGESVGCDGTERAVAMTFVRLCSEKDN
jgi:hypothetical protein